MESRTACRIVPRYDDWQSTYGKLYFTQPFKTSKRLSLQNCCTETAIECSKKCAIFQLRLYAGIFDTSGLPWNLQKLVKQIPDSFFMMLLVFS